MGYQYSTQNRLYIYLLKFSIYISGFTLLVGCSASRNVQTEAQTKFPSINPSPTSIAIEGTEAANADIESYSLNPPIYITVDNVKLFPLNMDIEDFHTDSCIDLDQGENGLNDVINSDICFKSGTGTMTVFVLDEVNGASGYVSEMQNITFNDCKEHLSSYDTGSMPDFGLGGDLCILTNQNRLSKITIEEIERSEGKVQDIIISFVVWDESIYN